MKYIVDAHTLIWCQDSPEQLGASAADVLSDLNHQLLIGKGTIWEIGIKVGAGKLQLSKPLEHWIDFAIRDLKLSVIEIDIDHILRVSVLPYLGKHRDPFDRILAVQSLTMNVPVVSIDEIFDSFQVTRIWK